MTTLIDYAKSKEGGTGTITCPILATVAGRAGCSHRTLYMIALGHKQASHVLAKAIEKATDGEVAKETLRPDIWGEGEAA